MGLTYPSNKVCPKCGTGGYVWYLDNSEYVAKCTNCGHYFWEQDFPMCVLDKTQKPITNADRIRSMSDEELVEIFANNDCGYCRIHDFCFAKGSAINCEDVWLDWLRREAEEEGE